MHPLDWAVIAAYLVGIIGLGVALSRRANASAEAYLVADRKLPWWVIGFSDVAGAAGGDAFWVLIVFSGAFIGLYRFFWLSALFALPLGVLWARYWRRLRLVSPAQIYEERYGGSAAARYRGFVVVYSAFVTSAIVLAYVLQAFAQIMAPFLGWPPDIVLIVFCGVSVVYTMMSGLLGVAYSDVPQFLLLMGGRIALAVVLVGAAGGMGAMMDAVEATKGMDFLKPFPPGSSDLYGSWKVEPGTAVALAAVGLFGIAGTGSANVQRSLAARSELDAALGQMLNAVLTLAVRVLPLVVIGFATIALLPEPKGTDAWAELVKTYAGPGLLGLILVGVVSGYMSTIDTFLNFLTAGLFNDFYRRHISPDADRKKQLRFCRFATLLVTAIGFLWAKLLIDVIDADWINFINSVVGLFILPLAVLRWTWWRLNIWGEIAGFVVGVPLAWVVWFPLGLKDEPYWQSFCLLFLLGWGTILTVTLLTRPESDAVLRDFYRRVRPPGFWGPVARAVKAEQDAETAAAARRELGLDAVVAASGFGFCVALVMGVTAPFVRSATLGAGAAFGLLVFGVGFYLASTAAERARVVVEDG
jgi:Na+/proline symporter